MFNTRDRLNNATGSQQVVSLSQLSFKTCNNFTCLTSFAKINLNDVKHVVFHTRDHSKNATGSQQVVSLSHLSFKTCDKFPVFNIVYEN